MLPPLLTGLGSGLYHKAGEPSGSGDHKDLDQSIGPRDTRSWYLLRDTWDRMARGKDFLVGGGKRKSA